MQRTLFFTLKLLTLPVLLLTPGLPRAWAEPPSAPAGGAVPGPSTYAESSTHTQPAALRVKLPFKSGSRYQVIQGNHGEFTHTGFNEHAWDFGMPENTEVCAAASGRVVRVKQDGTSGGASSEFFSQGNTIIIDHGRGYFSQYLHLAPRSALVSEGDLVAGGDVIARSGNTGFSTMPHLHFQVQDATGRSLPIVFEDAGKPETDAYVTSGNDGSATTQYAGESHLPIDVFQKNSITLLTRNLPGHLYRRSQTYPVKGRISGKKVSRVAVYLMAANGGKPLYISYAKVDRDGFFEANLKPADLTGINWSTDRRQSNLFSLAIAPVNLDGSFWSETSVPVCVR